MTQGNQIHLHPRKILLPVDFSPSSDAALETASEFAQHFQAQLVLVHIVPMLPMISASEYSSCYFPQQEFLEDARKEASERLATTVDHLAGTGVTGLPFVEVGNDVVGNIMMVIEREHIDMVVISTHGLSGWRPTVFGSIAEKVLRLVKCPILLLQSAKL